MRNQADSKTEPMQVLVSSQKTTERLRLTKPTAECQSYSFVHRKKIDLSETTKAILKWQHWSEDYRNGLTEIFR
jgi:hypothetical protein